MARKRVLSLLLAAFFILGASVAVAQASTGGRSHRHDGDHGGSGSATPIKHVVVIFQENVSFDHYFGTYPNAANTDGQTFHAGRATQAVDGLPPARSRSLPRSLRHSTNLLSSNPNAALPQRLDSSATGNGGHAGGQLTCDQDHDYSDEQQAFDNGNMDHFVQSVGTDGGSTSPFGSPCQAAQVMDYYDGNTVTALWNYAQHFSMSDNSFGTTFGPSSPGAINLASGDTGNVDTSHMANNPPVSTPTSPDGDITPDGKGGFSLLEYNWHLPGIPGSVDQVLSRQERSDGLPFDLAGMFDFRHPSTHSAPNSVRTPSTVSSQPPPDPDATPRRHAGWAGDGAGRAQAKEEVFHDAQASARAATGSTGARRGQRRGGAGGDPG